MPIVIDGVESSWLAVTDPLARAAVISLFTWRRAAPDDRVEGARFGWWGDGLEDGLPNDQIGSRLWLLSREKVTLDTINRARQYGREALQWFVDDGVATAVDVTAERIDVFVIALQCVIRRVDGTLATLRFNDLWRFMNV
ncbi:phage GP46 family protein [uncultured Pseudacidovorax sp.]|uniref:phage GP46 family protein n=1 Tax=uncultured Pseudacidovorax sp. TaxID=679313 RepID=UPI0025D8356E|nr:phage GP46 family protein [uncultured Pseudacidovorax sp.]